MVGSQQETAARGHERERGGDQTDVNGERRSHIIFHPSEQFGGNGDIEQIDSP
jgi:hypothetical protein